ncbi:MAG: O-antigen ligase family protein [Gaiellales bacterium]|nr:O-antigen ligase family protein [Gaiellales bacterium]
MSRRLGLEHSASSLTVTRLGALLLGMSFIVSLAASPAPWRSFPWTMLGLCGAGSVVLASSVRVFHRPTAVDRYLGGLVAVGYLLVLAGVLLADWPEQKSAFLTPLYAHLPTLRGLPLNGLAAGVQPNQIGGVLAVIGACAFNLGLTRPNSTVVAGRRMLRPAAWLLCGLCVAVVFLTGSRAALVAFTAAAMATLIMRDRRWVWVPAAAAFALGLMALLVPDVLRAISDAFLRDETASTKVMARLDIWVSALQGIEDHAFTGIGLGVFNDIVPLRYPYETVGLSYTVSQAHNIVLDTALALGVPGCLGLITMVSGLVTTSIKTIRRKSLGSSLSTCLLMGLVAYFIFGITDSLPLSNPSSLTLWFCSFGIIAGARGSQVDRFRNCAL